MNEFNTKIQELTSPITVEQLDQDFPDNKIKELMTELQSSKYDALYELQKQLGVEVHLVGGSVRDAISGSPAKDADFVIRFSPRPDFSFPDEYISEFENFFGHKNESGVISGPYGKMIKVGQNFGVYKFTPIGSDEEIDIALPRTDHSEEATGSAKDIIAKSNPTMPIQDDISRRDFTVNGLVLKLSKDDQGLIQAQLLDYVGGLQDLKNKQLKAIGNPRQRLQESHDRILRAIRFSITKGMQLDPQLKEAIQEIVQGNDEQGIPRALAKRKPDGKLVVPKELVAINLLKSFAHDARATLELVDELGLGDDLFPQFFNHTPINHHDIPDRRLAKSINNKLLSSTPPNPEEDKSIRQTYRKCTMEALSYHQTNFPEAGLDELVFLLIKDLGKCHALKNPNNPHFHKDQYKLTQAHFDNICQQTGLNTMPKESSLKISPTDIKIWLHKFHAAQGLLTISDIPIEMIENSHIKSSRIARIRGIFPNLTEDPLWRILQSSIATSPSADQSRTQLDRLRADLQFVANFDMGNPSRFSDLQAGRLIQNLIMRKITVPKQQLGQLNAQIARTSESAYQTALVETRSDHTKTHYLTDNEAMTTIFEKVLSIPELRQHILKSLESTAHQFANLLPSDEITSEQLAKNIQRSLIRSFERRILLGFTEDIQTPFRNIDRTSDELLATDRSPELTRLEFGDYLIQALNLPEFINILRRELTNPNSLLGSILPELQATLDCQQDRRHHSEGDVYTHTALALEKLDPQADPETRFATLIHDIGKPPTQSRDGDLIRFIDHERVGVEMLPRLFQTLGLDPNKYDLNRIARAVHDHGKLYSLWQKYGHNPIPYSLLQELFPEGERDITFKLNQADAQASIPESGLRDDNDLLDQTSTQLELLDQAKSAPEYFEKLISDSQVSRFIVLLPSDSKSKEALLNHLHHQYLTTWSTESRLITNEELITSILQFDPKITRNIVNKLYKYQDYQSQFQQPKQFGKFQSRITEFMLTNGRQPTDQELQHLLS